ncbi:histone-lysine N-methyltransferase, H3 lysine-79 specific-like [Osmia bicornis bicornis]|uniref:histone-lysine N-methyltransferase, H3 lysine-79 specific-like n=1 Tax=Osmia bicornis bicornis TaxID=1437191 RepID=UPI0010F96D8E|nr:histone-lysine N-methyltransferase, H3 lysine-79 specific-like [Osmia bicornis bicornis]XP_046144253.1 histone-lysine N-methyltransferase, H3 lysine-79 specific-like [Osmia bicornis bicornis]
MEDDIDIYEDLPSFETKPNENSVGNNEKDIPPEQIELKKQIAELTIKLENFQKLNENLELNLLSLLKTAKGEIARKDMVINDLRKKLDDVTFKRGVHSRVNESIVRNSTVRNTVINNHYKPTGLCLPPQETKFETLVTDLQCNQIKEQQNKSTLTPITVFGERLRKRIIDEQNLEKKEKLNSNPNSNNNDSSSVEARTEKYIGESDKENGSFTSTNLSKIQNVQPSTVVQLTEQECTKSPLTTPKITTTDSELDDKNKIDIKIEQMPVTSAKFTRKRTVEETKEHLPVKRIKLEEKKCLTESRKKENVSKCTTIELFSNISEKRNESPKSSDTGYTYDPSTKVKKFEPFVTDDSNKKESRKVSRKNSDASCNDRIMDKRFSKRQMQSTENHTFRPDERNTDDRCLETFKRDTHRNVVEHRRTRQREDRYASNIIDHRSFYVKEATPYAKSPEGRYGRGQRVKHSNYGDRFEKHYDYRGPSADKLKSVNKELCGTRDIKKRTNVERNSIDRKTNSLKKNNHYEEYGGRRLRSTDRIAKLEREKQNVYNELQRINIERPRERTKEFLKRNSKKDNYSVTVQIERIDEENKELKYCKESEKRAKESKKSVTCLEEGELADSPEKRDKRKKLKDEGNEEDNRELSDVSSSINKDVKNELVEEPKISIDNVLECPLTKQEHTVSNLEVNEGVENVENIEKFIRELASNDTDSKKTCETVLETVCSTLDEKMLISERDIEEKSIMNEKKQQSKSENTCSSISEGEEFFANVDDAKAQARESKDEVPVNGLIVNSMDSCLFNKTTEVSGDQSKPNCQIETVAKEDLLSVLGSKSPCTPSISSLESSKKTVVNDDKITIMPDDTKDDIPNSDNNDNNEQIINQNQLATVENKEKEHSLNATVATKVEQTKKERGAEGKKKESNELKKSSIRKRDDAKAKRASLNVQGRVVVFVRRKKPVCLADNNANMTILINDKKQDINETNSSNRITAGSTTLQCNSPLKKPRISEREARKIS